MRELITRLWGGTEPGSAVHVTLGDLPPGHRAVETYAVVPSPSAAKFLVPLGGRAAAAASLTRYNSLRSGKVRLTRAVLGTGYRVGLAPVLLRHRLTVGVRADVPEGELAGHLLSEHLREVLGVPDLVFGLGVRPLDPNSKPTLQLFSGDGTPVGYAKVGWSPATRALAATEAEASTAVAVQTKGFRVPAVLHHGAWNDLLITVTAPLPPDVRGHVDPDAHPDPAILRAIAESSGARVERLAASTFVQRLQDEAAAMDDEPELARALTGALQSLTDRYGDAELQVGRWHGDWVPWNIGHSGGDVHVWDWEHSADAVPLGLDLLHWRFQVALVLRGEPLGTAVAAVDRAARDELGDLGVPPEARAALADLYLLEMFVRTYRLKRGGGGWNPALHPAMLDVLKDRAQAR